MKLLLVLIVFISSIYLAASQSTTACIINAADIVNITEFLLAQGQDTIQMVAVPNDTFAYDPNCLIMTIDASNHLVIQVDDVSTLAQFEGVFKASEFTQFLSIYQLTTSVGLTSGWSDICSKYLANTDMASLIQGQLAGTSDSLGMNWVCLMINSMTPKSSSGTSSSGTGYTNEFNDSFFVQVGDRPHKGRNFASKRFKTDQNHYPVMPRHIFDKAHAFFGIHTHHPEHTHQRRPHFVYDILTDLVSKLTNRKVLTDMHKHFIKELDALPKEQTEFFERLRYAYNHYQDNLADTAPELPNLIQTVSKYINSAAIQNLRNIVNHERMDGSLHRVNEILIHSQHMLMNSHHRHKLHNGTQQVMRIGTQHFLNVNLPTVPDRFPFADFFNPLSSYWDPTGSWSGFGQNDGNVLRSWVVIDWFKLLIWYFEWIFHINADGVCRPGMPWWPNPAKCNVLLFTGFPPLASANFTPSIGMCNEFSTPLAVYNGMSQLILGSLATNLTNSHPGWKPFLSWLIRYDNPSTPNTPYVGDAVVLCLIAKSLVIVLLFSGIITFIIFVGILRVSLNVQYNQAVAIGEDIEAGFVEFESNSLTATYQSDLFNSMESKQKNF